jgi:hypothetical protein
VDESKSKDIVHGSYGAFNGRMTSIAVFPLGGIRLQVTALLEEILFGFRSPWPAGIYNAREHDELTSFQ